jgi:hypothetical protein
VAGFRGGASRPARRHRLQPVVVAAGSITSECRTGTWATCSTMTVRSLPVSACDGAATAGRPSVGTPARSACCGPRSGSPGPSAGTATRAAIRENSSVGRGGPARRRRPAAPHLRSCAPDCRGNGFANCHREVIVDAALAESRQQALALKGILAEVGRQGDVKMSRKRASRILLLASPTVLLPVGIGVDNDR